MRIVTDSGYPKLGFRVSGISRKMGSQQVEQGYFHLGRNHVHLTERFGFVSRHLWLGNFGKRNRRVRARRPRLRFPKFPNQRCRLTKPNLSVRST